MNPILFYILALFLAGCGVKGPPVSPGAAAFPIYPAPESPEDLWQPSPRGPKAPR